MTAQTLCWVAASRLVPGGNDVIFSVVCFVERRATSVAFAS